MKTDSYYLAQANIAKMLKPLNDPDMLSFTEQLGRINSVADNSTGFIWRYITPDEDTKEEKLFGELVLFNMSVWESKQTLNDYVYRSEHLQLLRDKKKWFNPITSPILVLWWIPQNHIPTVEEAKSKLDTLAEHGPTEEAFTFAKPYPGVGRIVIRH